MSLTLHRTGLSTILTTLKGTATNKLKEVYKWPRRNFADPSLTYPFASIDRSELKPVDYSTVGQGGINGERILTRIRIFDTYKATELQYDAFTALVDTVLTALEKDSNLRLGQADQGCTGNWIVNAYVEPANDNTPQLLVGVIDCLGTYRTSRT